MVSRQTAKSKENLKPRVMGQLLGAGSHGERSEPWPFHGRTDTHASQKALSEASI